MTDSEIAATIYVQTGWSYLGILDLPSDRQRVYARIYGVEDLEKWVHDMASDAVASAMAKLEKSPGSSARTAVDVLSDAVAAMVSGGNVPDAGL